MSCGTRAEGIRVIHRPGKWLAAAVALLLIIGNLQSAPGQTSTSSTVVAGVAGRFKIAVQDRVLAQQIAARGGRLVADYGSSQLYEVDQVRPEMLEGGRAELRNEFNRILLDAGALDTTTAEAQARRKPVGDFNGRRLHLVQFAGPVVPAWHAELAKAGVRIVGYVPHDAYLVYGDAPSLARLQQWAATAAYVQWEGEYRQEDRIHPRARAVDAQDNPRRIGTDLFAVQLVTDPVANAPTRKLIDQLKLGPVRSERDVLQYHNVVVPLAPADLAKIAGQPDVVSIQPYFVPRKHCERQGQILAGNLTGSAPSGPGYLAWLAGEGFTQAQFTASGFAVDLSDSGIDDGTVTPNHFGLYVGGILGGTSRVIYNRLEGTPNRHSTIKGCDGHGTENSHLIGGYDDQSGFPHTDSSGFHYGLGICPFVRIGSSVVFDPDLFTFPDYPDLQSRAYHAGARISNNSWGASTFGGYDVDSQAYDALVRDAQPAGSFYSSSGNQEMVIVFSAGNDGPVASSVGAPGTAKNVITVGASEDVQVIGGSDGCGTPDSQANSANDLVSFSSRGPCTDGRKKPDLVAPGTHVSGGVIQAANPGPAGTADACFTGSGICGGTNSSLFFPTGQQFYTLGSGTSFSSPAVAGGCALLRQYFINQGLTPPSPAMTKACFLNSARYLTGTGANDTLWSNGQGMGELDLGLALDGAPRLLRDELEGDRFTFSGQTRTITGTIADSSRPLRVTLAWTDAPGSTVGGAFNNDLDLTVKIGGQTYKGNVFSGAYSTTGGIKDYFNNVESVFLPAGLSGDFTVTITAANINSDGVPNNADALDQDFALVAYNAVASAAPIIVADATVVLAESCTPTNGVVDPGETVTVSLALRNVGPAATANLVATLLSSGGVTSPSGAQAYGALASGGPAVAGSFTFTANGVCGGTVVATLQLNDGSSDLGTVAFSFPLGVATGTPGNLTYTCCGVVLPPVAGFAAGPTSGPLPLTVNFVDLSTGSITNHAWNFGDGGTSSAVNPSHSYSSTGTYSVRLIVSGPGGSDTNTQANLISVTSAVPPPVAGFSASPTSGTVPLTVIFADTSTGNITSREWDFGDGRGSILVNPTHSYLGAGTYSVSLTVNGPGGSDTATRINLISVATPPPPPPDTTPPTIVACAPAVTNNANASCQAAVPDFTSHVQATDNLTPSALLVKTQSPPAGTLAGIGTTAVTITVKDAAGNAASCLSSFTVRDVTPPVITAVAASVTNAAGASCQAPVPDLTGSVSATDSCTPGGTLVKSQSPAAGTLVGLGTSPVTVTVKDGAGNAATVQIQFTLVDGTPPVITGCAAPVTNAANADCQGVMPDFTAGVAAADNCATGAQLAKTQSPPAGALVGRGTTPVTITVTDPGGNAASCQTAFVVSDASPPVISACAAAVTNEVNGSGQAPVPDFATKVQAGDNCSAVGALVREQSPLAGTLVGIGTTPVTVTVRDGAGNRATCDATFTTFGIPPHAAFVAGPTTGPVPLAVDFVDLSAGTIGGVVWDFGDGATSTETSPTHTYTNAASYDVTLTAAGPVGTDTVTQTSCIVVSNAPVPLITSPPAVTNALAQLGGLTVVRAGATNVFTVGALDPRGLALSYEWAFGDGVRGGPGPSPVVEHDYPVTNCGPYSASVTVRDEWALVTSNLAVAAACSLELSKLQPTLNFAKTNADHCALIAKLDLSGGFVASGQQLALDVGGARVAFRLDPKGNGRNGAHSCRLVYNSKMKRWTLTVALNRGYWRDAWAAHGLIDAPIAKPGVPVVMAVIVVIGNEAFVAEPQLHYTATAGKTGTAK